MPNPTWSTPSVCWIIWGTQNRNRLALTIAYIVALHTLCALPSWTCHHTVGNCSSLHFLAGAPTQLKPWIASSTASIIWIIFLTKSIYLLADILLFVWIVSIGTFKALIVFCLDAVDIVESRGFGALLAFHYAVSIHERKAWPATLAIPVGIIDGVAERILLLAVAFDWEKTSIAFYALVFCIECFAIYISAHTLDTSPLLQRVAWEAVSTIPITLIKVLTQRVDLFTLSIPHEIAPETLNTLVPWEFTAVRIFGSSQHTLPITLSIPRIAVCALPILLVIVLTQRTDGRAFPTLIDIVSICTG